MSAPTAPEGRPATAREIFAACPWLLDEYIPEIHDDPRVAEQDHQLEDPATDAAFARLAIDHPEHCHHDSDYPTWQPGGAKPRRIQRKRTKGWRKPTGVVYVGRGSKWGNVYPLVDTQVRMPAIDGSDWEHEGRLGKTSGQRHAFFHPGGKITWHQVEDATPEQVVELYRRWLEKRPEWIEDVRRELVGRDLMCWCPLDQPCHADVLLAVANGGAA